MSGTFEGGFEATLRIFIAIYHHVSVQSRSDLWQRSPKEANLRIQDRSCSYPTCRQQKIKKMETYKRKAGFESFTYLC